MRCSVAVVVAAFGCPYFVVVAGVGVVEVVDHAAASLAAAAELPLKHYYSPRPPKSELAPPPAVVALAVAVHNRPPTSTSDWAITS